MTRSQCLSCGILVLCLFALTTLVPSSSWAKDLRIVVTTGDLGAIAREIVGEHGQVEVLVRPGEDPHYVDPRPSYVRHLARADMLIYVGLDLEIGWLPTLITGSRNRAIQPGQPGHFDASRHVTPKDVMTGNVDRSMGDVHPAGNPHYTTDPRQVARIALALGQQLGRVHPKKASIFEESAREFARHCIRLAQKWELKFKELPEASRKIVTYHKAWTYLVDWLGIEDVIQIEPNPGIPANPRHIARVAETISRHNIKLILQEEYYPITSANILAERAQVELVVVPAQTRVNQSYTEHINEIVEALYRGLHGK